MAVIPSKPSTKLIWASQGNRAEPTSDKQLEGWTQEIPAHELENWIQYKQDLATKYLYQEGLPEWDSSFEYNTTSYVKYEGIIYKLKEGAEVPNTNKQPDIETGSWDVAFEPYGTSSPLAEEIRKIKELEGYLTLYVSKANPVMDGIATAPEFQASAEGGHTFQGAGTDTGVFLNSNNEPTFKVNNVTKATVRNTPSLTSDDSTLVTTAMLKDFKTQIFNSVLPVGISIITQDSRNPSDYLGFGIWERDLEGRSLVGFSSDVSSSTPDWKKQVNNIYGKDTIVIAESQLPAHTHNTVSLSRGSSDIKVGQTIGARWRTESDYNGYILGGNNDLPDTGLSSSVGGGQPVSVVSESKVKFIWTRTA